MRFFFFFLLLINTNVFLFSGETSKKQNYIPLSHSFYDKEFLEKTVDFFKNENDKFDIYTSTQAVEELMYLKSYGLYRTEIIFLIKMCYDRQLKLKDIEKNIKKRKTLHYISKKFNYDLVGNFKKAREIKEKIEKNIDDLNKLPLLIENFSDEY